MPESYIIFCLLSVHWHCKWCHQDRTNLSDKVVRPIKANRLGKISPSPPSLSSSSSFFWSRHHTKRWLIKPKRGDYASVGFLCSPPQRAWVAASGLLFCAFSSRQNVHLCGYIHNYNLPWKAIPSIWQAEQWPERSPHVACAVNMLTYQTHLISPFWKTKMGQKNRS